MSNIQTIWELQDRISSPMENIIRTVQAATVAFERMDRIYQNIFNNTGQINNLGEQMQRLQRNAQIGGGSPPIPPTPPSPATWTRVNMPEVFNTSGLERYNQEITSVNNLMNHLMQTQRQVQQQVAGTNLFPQSMVQDITQINNRVNELRQAIQRIEQNPLNDLGADQVNNQIEVLRRQLTQAINDQSALNHSMRNMDIGGANEAYRRLMQNINNAERNIRDNIDAQEDFNSSANNSIDIYGRLKGAIGSIAGAFGIGMIAKTANDYQTALNRMQVQTGATNDQMEQMGQSMRNLYTNGMGESYEDVASSMAKVAQMTGQLGGNLEATTNSALLLRDAFEYDVGESVRAAEMMSKQFNISSAQAYDQIIQATQRGLDKNGDLLDSINEYSIHFNKLGYDSTQMFNMLANGVNSGTFSVDKLGDAIKEFSIRAIDGSDTTIQGFRDLGLNAKKTAEAFAQGGENSAGAFQEIINRLGKMKDPIQQDLVGVNLFGTMWEDLGKKGVLALGNINGSVNLTTNNLQKMNDIQYNDAWSALTALGRTINDSLAGSVSTAVNYAKVYIKDFTNGIKGNIIETSTVFGELGLAVRQVGQIMGATAHFIADNWSIIAPIIGGIAVAVGIYNAAVLTNNVVQGINTAIQTAQAIAIAIKTHTTIADVAATHSLTVAQWALNSAFLACPLTWIVVGIIAVVVAIYAGVAAFNKLTGSSVSATGIIVAGFYAIGAVIYDVFVTAWNIIASFVEFFVNVWKHPVYSVKRLFYNLVTSVINLFSPLIKCFDSAATVLANVFIKVANLAIGGINKLIEALNHIPGVNIGTVSQLSTVTSFHMADRLELVKTGLNKWVGDKPSDYWEAPKMVYKNPFAEAKKGYDIGANLGKNSAIKEALAAYKGGGLKDYTANHEIKIPDLTGGKDYAKDTAKNTKKTADAVTKAGVDLKLLRDIAEREVINRFTTAEIKVSMINNNTVKKDMDLDGISRKLRLKIEQEMNAAAEGVHY